MLYFFHYDVTYMQIVSILSWWLFLCLYLCKHPWDDVMEYFQHPGTFLHALFSVMSLTSGNYCSDFYYHWLVLPVLEPHKQNHAAHSFSFGFYPHSFNLIQLQQGKPWIWKLHFLPLSCSRIDVGRQPAGVTAFCSLLCKRLCLVKKK